MGSSYTFWFQETFITTELKSEIAKLLQRRHQGEDWGGRTMVAHEKNEKKDQFVSDPLLKILQFYPGLL